MRTVPCKCHTINVNATPLMTATLVLFLFSINKNETNLKKNTHTRRNFVGWCNKTGRFWMDVPLWKHQRRPQKARATNRLIASFAHISLQSIFLFYLFCVSFDDKCDSFESNRCNFVICSQNTHTEIYLLLLLSMLQQTRSSAHKCSRFSLSSFHSVRSIVVAVCFLKFILFGTMHFSWSSHFIIVVNGMQPTTEETHATHFAIAFFFFSFCCTNKKQSHFIEWCKQKSAVLRPDAVDYVRHRYFYSIANYGRYFYVARGILEREIRKDGRGEWLRFDIESTESQWKAMKVNESHWELKRRRKSKNWRGGEEKRWSKP